MAGILSLLRARRKEHCFSRRFCGTHLLLLAVRRAPLMIVVKPQVRAGAASISANS